MKQSRATLRYAKALLELSIEQNSLKESYNDMIILNKTCSENKELSLLLKSPVVQTDKKLKILEKLFANRLSKNSMMFINIITKKKRESLLALICKSFIEQYKTFKKIEAATITTASPLDEELKEEVIKYIRKHGENDVELKEIIDESIIGGAIIRLGDKQLDTSISNAVSELKQKFNKNLYIQDF
tara:strand:+ start:195 stop:752 length:558 start_codon:yes stop_codon:yes gene_type:complete